MNIQDRCSIRSLRGFTLIELMVTLSVLAILTTLGVPSFMATIRDNRLATTANEMLTDLAYARSEAVTRGGSASLCASSDGSHCATSGNWEQGWIVFADSNGDGVVDSGDSVLRIHSALAEPLTLRAAADSAIQRKITFDGMGLARRSAGQLSLCQDNDAEQGRIIDMVAGGSAMVMAPGTGFSCE